MKKQKTKLIGINELSAILGVSREMLYWHMGRGLPVARKAVRWGFRIEEVEEYFRVYRGIDKDVSEVSEIEEQFVYAYKKASEDK
ncbi:MAG: hypothetical protein ABIJ40_06655 [Bacteroidota bacterium]